MSAIRANSSTEIGASYSGVRHQNSCSGGRMIIPSAVSYLRGLHDDAVPCGESRRNFLDSDEQRMVERLARIENASVLYM